MSGLALMLIEWQDSVRPMPEWQLLSEFEPSDVVTCVSVGYLVHDGAEVKALAQNLGCVGEDSAQASGVIHIPTCSIVRQVTLVERGIAA